VRGDITHLDLIQVNLKVAIEAEVHIEYVGTPIAVADDGAIVETLDSSVTITALPNAIPSSIEVDITHLELHDTLTVADLPKIDGVEYAADPDHPLLTVLLPAAEVEAEPVETDMMEGDEVAGDEARDDDGESESDSDEG
jgi:large subunit ribosomal protein L25